ncbi:hypothetical protein LGK95_08610 [Clostridium algoriphilum]|uniref:hypothetical protein n=1 Tax=Clostridium algoriphilum TaxID=198347 RepID=UPI001CF56A53|nr:hypothetical protein [Clostridium algoriphilum]MCB2293582.1 hypothetical protein [Clostridium algoriphilum]
MEVNTRQNTKLFNYKIDDKVYVYKKKEYEKSDFTLDEDFIGTIVEFKQQIWDDFFEDEYVGYTAIIELKNGKRMCIKDEENRPFFKKYSFILLKDLKKILEKANRKLC